MDYRPAFSEIIAELEAAERPEFLRRHLRYEVLPRKAVVLKGVRRSGKSTLLLQIEEAERREGRACLTMNFIDERLAQLEAADLGQMFDAYYQTHDAASQGKLSLLLDEIQVVDGWEAFVERQLRIPNRRVFLTGSSAKLLSREIASSMRGRSLAYEVFPFDFGEYLALQGLRPSRALGQEDKGIIKARFQRYLTEGGFPETVGRQAATRTRILQEYFDVLLLRDVIERHAASSPILVKRFLLQLISQFACPFTINKSLEKLRAQGLPATKSHVSEMLEWFHDAYAVFPVMIFASSVQKQNTNPKKLYVVDTGFINALTVRREADSGRLLENLIFLCLRRPGADICYYRTRDGYEVDFIAAERRLVQVAWSLEEEETRRRELRALSQAMEELDVRESTLVTMDGAGDHTEGDRTVHIVPAWQFALDSSPG